MKNSYFLFVTLFVFQISMANCTVLFDTDPTIPTLLAISVCDDNSDGFATFDLTVQNSAILAAQTGVDSDYTVSYHETLTGANVGDTSVINPNAYYNINPFTQTVYVRISNVNTNSFAIGSFQVIVNSKPYASDGAFVDCDNYNNPFDGIYSLDLTQFASSILGGQNPSLYTVTYYTSQINADSGIGPILTVTNYTAINGQNIWVRVQNNSTGCYALATINIRVDAYPNPIINTVNDVNTICVDYLTDAVVRALTLNSGISNASAYSFQWFEDGSTTPIAGAIGSTYTVNTPVLNGDTRNYTVRVTSNSVLGCSWTSSPFAVLQSGPATPNFGSIGYEVINLSGVQSIIVNLGGYGTYEYSLDNGSRQQSNVFNNVSLGSHTITIWDTEGVVNYSCDPYIIIGVVIATSPIPAPTGLDSQTFNPGATLANIVVLGESVKWYSSPYSNATLLPLNTLLVNGTTYYATQTVGGVESTARLAVTVQVTLGVTNNEILTLNYTPNPVKDVLNLESNSILKSVLVYNLIGQKVYEHTFDGTTIAVDLSSLKTGNYIAKVQGDLAQRIIKIVKQ